MKYHERIRKAIKPITAVVIKVFTGIFVFIVSIYFASLYKYLFEALDDFSPQTYATAYISAILIFLILLAVFLLLAFLRAAVSMNHQKGRVEAYMDQVINNALNDAITSIKNSAELLGANHNTPLGSTSSNALSPNLEARVVGINVLKSVYDSEYCNRSAVLDIFSRYIESNCRLTEPENTIRPDISSITEFLRFANREISDNEHFLLHLRHSNLAYINFNGGLLSPCHFEKCSFRSGRFEDAKMGGSVHNEHIAFFEECEFINSRFAGATLTNARFKKCDLRSCDFYFSNLERASFEDCRIDGANFGLVSFEKTYFINCSLRNTFFQTDDKDTNHSLASSFGVASGIGKTIISDSIEVPDHWFRAEEVAEDSADHRQAYEDAYKAWLWRGGWSTRIKKK